MTDKLKKSATGGGSAAPSCSAPIENLETLNDLKELYSRLYDLREKTMECATLFGKYFEIGEKEELENMGTVANILIGSLMANVDSVKK